MSEQILKLQPTNSYGETAIPGAFVNSKLLDFTIPGNSTYDLSKSYVAINMSAIPTANTAGAPTGVLDSDTALYSQEIVLQVGANPATAGAAPVAGQYQSSQCASLVRNAQMFSQNRGMVESIRRVDTLRQILFNLENDKTEIKDNLNGFGTFQGRRGLNNRTTSLHHTVTNNTNVNGDVDLALKSYAIARDFRIPLSDLFGVGNAMWNGQVYGDTRINLELNINKLYLMQLGGDEDTSQSSDNANMWGAVTAVTVAQSTPINLLVLTTGYMQDNMGLLMPFHVGQCIVVNGTNANGGGTGTPGPITEVRVIIDSISIDNAGLVTITTRTPWMTATAAAAGDAISDILIKADVANVLTSQIRINKAEIVLSQMPGVNGPSEIDYRTYSTEEQNGNDQPTYFHQYAVEPQAQNLIVAHCNAGEIACQREWLEYRMAINNVDVTGNRSVRYAQNLHQDRVLRFMNNRGQDISNLSLRTLDNVAIQGTNNDTRNNQLQIFPICETLPVRPEPKTVTLNLEGNPIGSVSTTIGDVIMYKELIKTI
tara:strand:- start:1971 stop:3593 length:1623 start_codon:yes stop_codon:yes gene_type:complete